jgi:hypothetical protein
MAKLTGYQVFRYPREIIDESDDYIRISVVNYKPPGFGARKGEGFRLKSSDDPDSDLTKNLKTPVCSIILPMPQQIQDSKTVGWGEGEMNSLAGAAGGGAAGIIGSENPVQKAVQAVLGGAKSLGETVGNAKESIAAKFAADAVNSLIGQESISPFEAITRQTGSILNQNQELLFRGVSLRGHQFSWTLTPRSKAEADEIKNIIRIFKSSMSAKKQGAVADKGAGIFIQSPDVYQLQYFSGKKPHPFLNVFKICALTGITVDYTATGTYATYADGTPIQVSLGLTFQELTPIYAEDYNTTNGENGVGY